MEYFIVSPIQEKIIFGGIAQYSNDEGSALLLIVGHKQKRVGNYRISH